ncbi:histidinol-phosphate transaminase [uncultured Sunxiuqinia sp.]|uniref:pyridoxal phosphate-dependent aminotransferase n=1 Tax=uncultured Sunxiuqinia sp. TaxID=1573825 RepID=UPI00261A7BA5|nr:histidinol-phosphate transaminase [uncultured Sunxiuqinia sp.]
MQQQQIKINRQLFTETSHSPALIDMVGEEQLDQVIDFCFIANPYYPTDEMLDELKTKLNTIIKAYPSSNPKLARQTLAEVLQLDAETLFLGNGATELITIVEKYLIDDIAIPIPTFSEYIEKIRSADAAKLYQLDPKKDYQLNLQDYARWIRKNKVSAALIINPGNPTGQLMHTNELRQFLTEMKELKLILLDESFIDFADEQIPSLLNEVHQFKNLIIVRSMSKHCGVPGLRLGYICTSNPFFLKTIQEALPIWNINSIAEYFLLQLKNTSPIYHETRLRVIQDIRELHQKLKQLDGYKIYPTGSNFILLKIEFELKAFDLQMQLLEKYGLYVRDCSNKIGLDQYHIRVASQGPDKDQLLVDALQEIATSCCSA